MFTSATHDFLENEWRHLAGFLNTARITGYLRHGKGKAIHVVQNNLASLALPIHLLPSCKLPDVPNATPITVRCHVFGETDSTGNRIAALKAFEVATPDPSWLPPDYAFMNPVPADAVTIDFIPPETGITHDIDGSNLIRVAGYCSSITLEGVDYSRGVNGKLTFLLLQADSDFAIPVRCYGRLASAFADRIEEGTPIQIAASFRVDAKRTGEVDANGKAVMAYKPYLHAISDPMVASEAMIDEATGKAVQDSLIRAAAPMRRRKPSETPDAVRA